ncbi:hypothetical protein GCM10028808_73230 [Spirosoma migulaei]
MRVNAAPTADNYTQFAIMVGNKNVMGTFRAQLESIDEYCNAIKKFYTDFGFALVEADRIDQEIRIRVHPNDRFKLNSEPMRIGIGTVKERNLNTPALLAQKVAGLSLAAEDRYTLSVSADIQKGNVFGLETLTYTAIGTEKPSDILRALGVSSGSFSRAGGSTVVAYAQTGSQVLSNTNHPTLQLLYVATSGGNDQYTAVVSADVLTGNVYQVAAAGSTTRTVTATSSDTKATIESLFNTTGGYFVLPAGSVPVITVLTGTQRVANANNPSVSLKNTLSLPLRTVDRYTVFVGSSVVQGNEFSLTIGETTQVVSAGADDTPLSIAAALGYDSNPFIVDVEPGVIAKALARKGPLYNEENNLANVTLISSRTYRNLPYVAEVAIPFDKAPGTYQLVLQRGLVEIGRSNYIKLRSDKRETALVRFGTLKPESVFGLTYAEDGLMQQIRLPIYLDSPRGEETENIYSDLDFTDVRGRMTVKPKRALTTTMQGAAFHWNMRMALKHPALYIDSKPYFCEGPYSETENQGKGRIRQGQATLTAKTGLDYRPTFDPISDSLSITYCSINEVAGLGGLWLAVKRLNFVSTISEGVTIPAAEYDLLIRTGADPLRLTISHENRLVTTLFLTPNRLNHLRNIRLEPGCIRLNAIPVTIKATSLLPDLYDPQDADVLTQHPETVQRSGDFGPDFYDPDFN